MPEIPEETPEWMKPLDEQPAPIDLKTDVAHPARIYDYTLGGKTNFAADREAAEKVLAASPNALAAVVARENRAFMHRAVRHLARQGIRQFLDVGTGIPTPPNLHEVAQTEAPESRVVYVDNDPIVLAHARALLTSAPEGRTAYIDASLADPEGILSSPGLLGTLDLTRPVALTLVAVLHYLPEDADSGAIIKRLLAPLPPGSHLVLTHLTADFASEEVERGVAAYNSAAGARLRPLERAGVEALFDGLELLDPGVVPIQRWRPDGPVTAEDAQVSQYAGVARKA